MYVGRFNLWKQSQKSYNQQVISIRLRFHSMIMVERPTYVVHVFNIYLLLIKQGAQRNDESSTIRNLGH